MSIDIIIPTHNSARTVGDVLSALRRQVRSGDRVIVVDDGSTDDTARVLQESAVLFRTALVVHARPHGGAAAARNTGLTLARGNIVLFLGADILPAPSLLARHRALHDAYPEETVGCLGFVTWDPALPPTPFMVWLEHGSQNAYRGIAGERWVDAGAYCYGANLSLKRSILTRVGGFDERNFTAYGWEDIDLGMRLAAHGLRLAYEPTALGWHRHRHTLVTFCRRQELVGRGIVAMARLHPARVRFEAPLMRASRPRALVPLRVSLRPIVAHLATWAEERWIVPRLYARVTGWAFTHGVQSARRGEAAPVENTHNDTSARSSPPLGNFIARQSQKYSSPYTSEPAGRMSLPRDVHSVVHKE